MTVRPSRLALATLLLTPVGITAWFVSDGGIANGLNRLAYEVCMGLFFLGYGLLMVLLQGISAWRHQPCPHTGRLGTCSLLASMVWTLAAIAWEHRA